MALFVGLDLGTSGVRACAIDTERQLQAEAALPLPPSQRDDRGGSKQQPADWLTISLQVLHGLGQSLGTRVRDIAAIAVDGTSASLLPCTLDGQPLGPALMYDDSSCGAELNPYKERIPVDSPARSASTSLGKWLHFHKQLTGNFIALHQADWISGCLCGDFGHSDANNAIKLGYDALAHRWPDWLAEIMPAATLPQVHAAGTPLGSITPSMARQTGLPPDTLVCSGTTDSTAAVLASGIHRPGQAVSVLGSTLVLKVLSEQPLWASEYGIYSQPLGDHWLVGGASNSGGAVLLKYFSQEQLTRMTPLLRPDQPTGMDYYPLLRPGERFPVQDPDLQPRLEPRPEEPLRFFQAMLEGMANIEATGYRLLQQIGAPWPSEVVSIGGGSTNPAWQQMRQDRLGLPVRRAAHQQAAYGTALLALNAGLTGNVR